MTLKKKVTTQGYVFFHIVNMHVQNNSLHFEEDDDEAEEGNVEVISPDVMTALVQVCSIPFSFYTFFSYRILLGT